MNTVLSEPEWRRRSEDHRERVRPWVSPRLERRARGSLDPVDDFLFTYYSHRPAQLLTWHPGIGVICDDPSGELLERRGYVAADGGVTVDPTAFDRSGSAQWIHDLLTSTRQRTATFGCFGLHEWAMVYRLAAADVRHPAWPLRLSPDEIADVVDGLTPRCTHYDAFRFFTAQARPLNLVQLTRADQMANEQPGCLHAAMDLYKWAYKLSPLTPSELVADCFELAREVRTVDMQASPYDLSGMGLAPIAVETADGRDEYVARQREFSRCAEPLRERLIALAADVGGFSLHEAGGSSSPAV